MIAPQPQTIYEKLFDRLISAANQSNTNLDRDNLLIRSLYVDAEKLQKANFDQGLHVLAILDCECGDFDSFLQRAQLLRQRNPGNVVYIDMLVNAAHKRLMPSFAAHVLDVYTEKPHAVMPEGITQLMDIGAYKHFLKADSVMQKAHMQPIHQDIYQSDIAVAKAMDALGMSQERMMAIIEQAGKVLAANGLKWRGMGPLSYTLQNNEIGAWYNIDVTPEQAAKLDDELYTALIDAELDTEPFFLSFVGIKA